MVVGVLMVAMENAVLHVAQDRRLEEEAVTILHQPMVGPSVLVVTLKLPLVMTAIVQVSNLCVFWVLVTILTAVNYSKL